MTEKPKSPVRERMKRTGETYEVAFAAIRREQAERAARPAASLRFLMDATGLSEDGIRGAVLAQIPPPLPRMRDLGSLDEPTKA